MAVQINKPWSQKDLVARLFEIRSNCRTRGQLLMAVNEWFVSERLTKADKHLAFLGMYQAFELFDPRPTMTEMIEMWHLCDMEDYTHPLDYIPKPLPERTVRETRTAVPA